MFKFHIPFGLHIVFIQRSFFSFYSDKDECGGAEESQAVETEHELTSDEFKDKTNKNTTPKN